MPSSMSPPLRLSIAFRQVAHRQGALQSGDLVLQVIHRLLGREWSATLHGWRPSAARGRSKTVVRLPSTECTPMAVVRTDSTTSTSRLLFLMVSSVARRKSKLDDQRTRMEILLEFAVCGPVQEQRGAASQFMSFPRCHHPPSVPEVVRWPLALLSPPVYWPAVAVPEPT